jgi:2-polyprenyl-3-methyl-5-hydroxy-6-metoxy-1,4-benzoquinol methylase
MSLYYDKEYFDYIIFGDVLEHLNAPDKVLIKIREYMKKNSKLIISVSNIMHISVLLPLLRGEFHYEEAGILDKTHIKFFTLKSIISMLVQCGYAPETYININNDYESNNISETEKKNS